MDIIDRIDAVAESSPSRVAHSYRHGTLTYGELRTASDALASRLGEGLIARGSPVVVYGHKEPAMLVAFLGCVKAGHPYIPIDASWPADRVAGVIAEARATLVLAARDLPDGVRGPHVEIVDVDALVSAGSTRGNAASPRHPARVLDDEPFYIIYTSGSTGRPKGVQISKAALTRFVDWCATLVPDGPHVWLNQAPFSFDLSIMDLYGALASGSTLHSIDAALVASPRALFADLATSDITVWVSTPSFADLCLADPAFDVGLLPNLRTFLFCGETLAPATARTLKARFGGVTIYNTYGPTESTVAVTAVEVDDALLATDGPLPVGAAKPGTTLLIRDPGGNVVTDGEAGEVVIAGDTVSLGYYQRPDLTAEAFAPVVLDGVETPAYRTGDLGRLVGGQLFFGGRIDFQVKLHGYRIELEDIENNLRRLAGVQQAAVVPVTKPDGSVAHLVAHVQLAEVPTSGTLRLATELKRQLRTFVPDYMVPKVFSFTDRLPLTDNGKVDRAALKADA